MTASLVRYLPPTRLALSERLGQVRVLESELETAEAGLGELRQRLREFECRYVPAVGDRYRKLEALRAEVERAWETLRAAKNGSTQAASMALIARGVEAPANAPARPSRDAQRLFRELARRLHPDLTSDPREHAQRHEAMAQATHAYRLNDVDGLRQILAEWESHPDRVQGTDVGSRFLRALRQAGWLRIKIERTLDEIDALRASPLVDLMHRAEEARGEGWSLLAEMQKRVDEHLAQAEEDLERVTEALSGLDADTTRVIKVNAEMI